MGISGALPGKIFVEDLFGETSLVVEGFGIVIAHADIERDEEDRYIVKLDALILRRFTSRSCAFKNLRTIFVPEAVLARL